MKKILLIVALMSGFYTWARKYEYPSGTAFYTIEFSQTANSHSKQPEILKAIMSSIVLKYGVIFNEDASLETSASNEIIIPHPFDWGGQVNIRYKNSSDKEIWKELNNKTYFTTQKGAWVFNSFTGKKKTIGGFLARECLINASTGDALTGWVTDALPKTAGIQLLKGCEMALIALDGPAAKTILWKIEKQTVSWKEILSKRPRKQLFIDTTYSRNEIKNGAKSNGSYFPKFNIKSSNGKVFSNKSFTNKTTVFFFFSLFDLFSAPSAIKEMAPTSTGQVYLKEMEKEFKGKNLQVVGSYGYSVEEANFAAPSLRKLRNTNLVPDPNHILLKGLDIWEYPYVIIVDSKGIIKWSTACNTKEDIDFMIAKAVDISN